MAYTTINKSKAHHDTNLYQANGSGKTISGMEFQPDWIWTSNRDTASYEPALVDAIRGGTKKLFSARTDAESTDANAVTSFTSDGYVFGSSGSFNNSTDNYVNWCWKANGSGTSNTDGSITSTVSANTTAGFSIVKFTAPSSGTFNVGHGLGVAAKCILMKKTNDTQNWICYWNSLGSNKFLQLNTTATAFTNANMWQNTHPTSTLFYSNISEIGASGEYIAYCFAEKIGYSKFGSYTGNGNADGSFIYTGFKPKWLMLKRTDSSDWWGVFDSKRNGYNGANYHDRINEQSYAETIKDVDLLSNGFKMKTTDTAINASGGNYVFMAFGQSLVGSNNVPCTAR
tara:strand:- start:163 stop:1188 length:1026 start_codon:yes stop_codon:yes gene_type:complete